jgi:tetratricopeptide (TPR) repeat protein
MAKKSYAKDVGKLFAGVILLVVAVIGLGYGAVLREMQQAQEEYKQGDAEAALKHYEAVEARLQRFGLLKGVVGTWSPIPVKDRQNLILNQARLLYALKRFDDAAERLERENDLPGLSSDGRFLLLRGEISFRKAVSNYQDSPKKDPRLLEEALLAAEDSLRDSLRLSPADWDAKYNFEFINYVRNLMNQNDDGKIKILMENVRVKETQPKPLPPDQQS